MVIRSLFILLTLSLANTTSAQEWEFPVYQFVTGDPVQFEDGSYIRFGGRVQLDGNTYEGVMNNEAGGDRTEESSVRRFRLMGVGQWGQDWFFYLHVPLEAENDEDVLDAYVIYKGLGPGGWLRLGKQKEVSGLEWLSSSAVLPLIERSAVSRVLVGGRSKGLSLLGNYGSWLYMLGAYDANGFDSSDNHWVFNGRFLYKYEAINGDVTHFGLNLSERDEPTELLTVAPEIQKVSQVDRIGSGALTAEQSDWLGLELLHVEDHWHLSSEVYFADYHQTNNSDYGVWGGYITVGWVLTGEKRQYKSTYSTFGGISPASEKGAWELVGRWSYLDLADNNQGNQANVYTAGINWFANQHVAIMFNVVYADYDQPPNATSLTGVGTVGDTDGLGAAMRFQLTW